MIMMYLKIDGKSVTRNILGNIPLRHLLKYIYKNKLFEKNIMNYHEP